MTDLLATDKELRDYLDQERAVYRSSGYTGPSREHEGWTYCNWTWVKTRMEEQRMLIEAQDLVNDQHQDRRLEFFEHEGERRVVCWFRFGSKNPTLTVINSPEYDQ